MPVAFSFAHVLCSLPILQCALQTLQHSSFKYFSHRFHFDTCNFIIKFCWAQTQLRQCSILFILFSSAIYFSLLISHSGFPVPFSPWEQCPAVAWAALSFVFSHNIAQSDNGQTIVAAATSQVKLCPFDEEELAIWFRLIEVQFATAGIKSQKLRYANTLASLPKLVLYRTSRVKGSQPAEKIRRNVKKKV